MSIIQTISSFLQTTYGQFAVLATIVATIWGFCKAIGALRKWLRQRHAKYESIVNSPDKTYALITQLKQQIERRDKEMQQCIQDIKKQLFENNQATASIALQKLMWSYHTYVLQKNAIPLDVRTALVEMYNQYKKSSWHNHVPEDFVQAIMNCEVAGYAKTSDTVQ